MYAAGRRAARWSLGTGGPTAREREWHVTVPTSEVCTTATSSFELVAKSACGDVTMKIPCGATGRVGEFRSDKPCVLINDPDARFGRHTYVILSRQPAVVPVTVRCLPYPQPRLLARALSRVGRSDRARVGQTDPMIALHSETVIARDRPRV